MDHMPSIKLIDEPEVSIIAKPQLLVDNSMVREHIVNTYRRVTGQRPIVDHNNVQLVASGDATDAAKLCEIAGRTCYMSFDQHMGRKTTQEYLDHIKEVKHKSVLYHANWTFFISGISRRLSLELNRHIIGVSRSQLSTRFVPHHGAYVIHPGVVDLEHFREECQRNYAEYLEAVKGWDKVKGLERKRILEQASAFLNQAAETVIVVTYNVESFRKMYYERSSEAADLEFQQLVYFMAEAIKNVEPILFDEISLSNS